MLSREENELLTRVGPGTPFGNLMRRYWIPALFSTHLPEPDGPPVRLKLLGENLIAFRDTNGKVGLLEEHCAHRGASLFFGRNEECGLRCVYHGWKYDVMGQCVDMPNEPPETSFADKIRVIAYPCREMGGVVWAYMGPAGTEPEFPELEWTLVPDSHRHLTRRWQETNWLQGVEGGFDPTHLAFLHRGTREPGRPTREAIARPSLAHTVATGCGLMFANRRILGDGRDYWSVNQWMLPFHKLITRLGDDDPIGVHAWVPIDDENTMLLSIEYHPDRPLTEREHAAIVDWNFIHGETDPATDRPVLNKANDYLIDRELQANGGSFTGIKGIGTQDSAVQESMGAIYDRSQEHLGGSDAFIVTIREHLLQILKDFESEGVLRALDPTGYRVRSAGLFAPSGLSLEEAVGDAIVARVPATERSAAERSRKPTPVGLGRGGREMTR